ncbi:MAG: signal peptidase I [Ktedonobacteraceae bacterium]|nr:signal peptidase I [Ktedonobacteraceae bacterium]
MNIFEHPFFSEDSGPGENDAEDIMLPPELLTSTLQRLGLEAEERVQTPLEHFYPDLQHAEWQVRLATTQDLEKQCRQILLNMFRNDDNTIRAAVTRVVGSPDKDVQTLLLQGLHDPAWNVRAAAVATLGEWNEPIVVDALISMASDEDVSVRTLAIQVLGALERNVPQHILIDALQDHAWEVRMAAVFALDNRQDHALDANLLAVLEDKEIFVRKAAQEVLYRRALSHPLQKEQKYMLEFDPLFNQPENNATHQHAQFMNKENEESGQMMFASMKVPSETTAKITTKRRKRPVRNILVAAALLVAIISGCFIAIPALHLQTSFGSVTVGNLSLSIGENFLYKNFTVVGHAMEPTIRFGTSVIVDTSAYQTARPKRSDIILLKVGGDYMVKRVIGLPGDVLTIDGTKVIVNGKLLAEPYIKSGDPGLYSFKPIKNFKVPVGQFFVLGDNRMVSNDSRYYGTIPLKDIIGQVIISAK